MKGKNEFLIVLAGVLIVLMSCIREQSTVSEVMDRLVTRLYEEKSMQELENLSVEQAMALLSEDDLKVFSSAHWTFDVNVPVVVSVMRSTEQEIVPFWLNPAGFVKTELTVKNETTIYEVWQKPFKAGRIGLGINGVENYSLHYFVSVAPQKAGDNLLLSNFFPENQYVGLLDDGSFTYHDWDELVLFDVPDELKGQQLLTTVRGRGVESHLAGAFRKTKYPSSSEADQFLLTWSDDPSTSVDIQWRTDTTVSSSELICKDLSTGDEWIFPATRILMEDRMLMNDRFIFRHTAKLRNLKPGVRYAYKTDGQKNFSEHRNFQTAAIDDTFSFVWFGDTHYSPEFGNIFNLADQSHPETAFYMISGDLVSDGLHRNQWDDLFEYPKNIISAKPLMAVPGNHDNRAGLGAKMYREMFSYPENGPENVPSEQTYAFTYKNALFLMIDATSPDEAQTGWIEEQLKKSTSTWKFAVFHFPPYNWDEPYTNIQKEWVPLFDKYHVDLVMGGHVHYYMRSKPMKDGKIAGSASEGTIYLISIAIPSHTREIQDEPYAEVQKSEGQYYQHISVEGNTLVYKAYDSNNSETDTFVIKK